MKPNSEIMERLRKILTLASDRGAQPGEIEAAMAKAKELAIRHNIELGSIDLTNNEKVKGAIEVETDSSTKTRSKYQQPYHGWIYSILAEIFDVKTIRTGYPSPGGYVMSHLTIIGEPVDVAIAVAVFPYLEKVFPATLSRAVSAGKLIYCAADTNGCYRGLYIGIKETNEREKEKLNQKEAHIYSMVVRNKMDMIDQRMRELFPKLKKGRNSSYQISSYATRYGYREGKKINLRQISSSDKSKIS